VAGRMIYTPDCCVDVQRAGPATGVPTKTETRRSLAGAGRRKGDYPPPCCRADNVSWIYFTRFQRCFQPLRHYQCARLVLSDLLISKEHEHRSDDRISRLKIDRGRIDLSNGNGNARNPASGIQRQDVSVPLQNTPERTFSARGAGCRECGYIFTARDRRAR